MASNALAAISIETKLVMFCTSGLLALNASRARPASVATPIRSSSAVRVLMAVPRFNPAPQIAEPRGFWQDESGSAAGRLRIRPEDGRPTDRTRGQRVDESHLVDHVVRAAGDRLWHCHGQPGVGGRPGQSAHAGDRRRHRGGRAGLSPPPVYHDRRRRRRDLHRSRSAPLLGRGGRLPDRRRAVGGCRLHRHERFGPGQCPHRPGRDTVAFGRPQYRVQGRRRHGDVGGGLGPARCRRLLLRPDRADGLRHRREQCPRPRGDRCARGARLRGLADLDLRPPRRRYLHQGRGRRRRPRGQGRSRAFRKTTRAIRPPSRTTSATTSAIAPAWRRTSSRPMR